MIGVRNPRKQSVTDGNDMEPKSAIIWVNELRLSDYTNKGGWTAMALARTNLADIGNLSLYGAYTTAGFGNLEDNLTNLELVNNLNTRSHLQHHEEFVQIHELILKQGLNGLGRVRKVNNQMMGIFAFCKLFNNVTFADAPRTFNHQCASRCLMLFPIEQSFVYFSPHGANYIR